MKRFESLGVSVAWVLAGKKRGEKTWKRRFSRPGTGSKIWNNKVLEACYFIDKLL